MVSAELDGEASPLEVTAAEHHLVTCATCRDHREAVLALHRAIRVAPAADVPDLSAAILARVPRPDAVAAAGSAVVWRTGLALVAVAQLLTAFADLGAGHLARDQASWEAALAAGFAWAAWRPARAAGLLPVAAVFTLLLLVNGGLAAGGADTHHLLAPVGFVLLAVATRGGDRPTRARTA